MKNFLAIFLGIIATTSTHAYFISGGLYQKDNSYIALLGDCHSETTTTDEKQIKNLIEYLKKYDREKALTIVEDATNYSDYDLTQYEKSDSQKYKKVFEANRKKIDTLTFEHIPALFLIKERLEKEGISTFNIEWRRLSSIFEIGDKTITTADLLKEFTNAIQTIETYKNDESIVKTNQYIARYYHEKTSDILEKNKSYIDFLKEHAHKTYDFYTKDDLLGEQKRKKITEKTKINLQLRKHICNLNHILDINIIHHILKNKDKELVAVCAGHTHTIEIGNVLQKVGYKEITHVGPKTKEIKFKMRNFENLEQEMEKAKVKPIKIKNIFEAIQ